ncbi:hypothetical protein M9H77_06361 [Catharanthus roseus]|uniref:Uncharacterized protein n=1 Tax=Catharanthus roseus TaxID=4058 RepID=A0ACC0BRX5_CATRO|nr:hypothetical protein M9H77_06361 [Catharanthus roseus]
MAASNSKWLTLSITVAFVTLSACTVYFRRRKSRNLDEKIQELEASVKAALEKCAAERQGRIRAQQALRKSLAQPNAENSNSYPMAPIATIQSCFSTRNGAPRQPLLVPLARACLKFRTDRVPPAALEGLEKYSHCWIIYVFHLNTDLEKLWKPPSQSKFKAKVRVPRLKGGRMGVFATRSPHRPCPIGLTVAKVEAVNGHTVLLSGVDLVDGTPILDIKPYLPYCDSIKGATIPDWVKEDNLLAVSSISFSKEFSSSLANSWSYVEKSSLYASVDEFQGLIRQVLTWDIRSASQRSRPHNSIIKTENESTDNDSSPTPENYEEDEITGDLDNEVHISNDTVIYHLILEGLDVSYRIDCNGNVLVDNVSLSTRIQNSNKIIAVT